jgi:hypothetical protein
MTYVDEFFVSLAAGAVNDQIYRANSVFDPDRTGGGHQPLGFDQAAALYNRYRVHAFKARIKFSASSVSYDACAFIVNGAKTYTSLPAALETNRQSHVMVQGVGATAEKDVMNGPLWKYCGRSLQSYHIDDTTGADVTTNPAETIDYHVVTHNPNGGAATLFYVVELEYDVVFYDAITPAQS